MRNMSDSGVERSSMRGSVFNSCPSGCIDSCDRDVVTSSEGEHLLKELPLYILEVERKIPIIFTMTGDVIEVEEAFAAEVGRSVRCGSQDRGFDSR